MLSSLIRFVVKMSHRDMDARKITTSLPSRSIGRGTRPRRVVKLQNILFLEHRITSWLGCRVGDTSVGRFAFGNFGTRSTVEITKAQAPNGKILHRPHKV